MQFWKTKNIFKVLPKKEMPLMKIKEQTKYNIKIIFKIWYQITLPHFDRFKRGIQEIIN
jgi:hypothetical protein